MVFPYPEPATPGVYMGMSSRMNPSSISMAMNHDMYGSDSPLCIHYDKTVYSACAVSAMPDSHLDPMSSLYKYFNADAGELFHEVGGLVHGYNSRDVVVFNGKHYHSPMPPVPAFGGKKTGRFSFVVFRNRGDGHVEEENHED